MRIKANVRPYGCSTISELAESSGFSRWAVSRFLHGTSKGSPTLRKRLLELMNEEKNATGAMFAEAERRIRSKDRKKAKNAKGRRKS